MVMEDNDDLKLTNFLFIATLYLYDINVSVQDNRWLNNGRAIMSFDNIRELDAI